MTISVMTINHDSHLPWLLFKNHHRQGCAPQNIWIPSWKIIFLAYTSNNFACGALFSVHLYDITIHFFVKKYYTLKIIAAKRRKFLGFLSWLLAFVMTISQRLSVCHDYYQIPRGWPPATAGSRLSPAETRGADPRLSRRDLGKSPIKLA